MKRLVSALLFLTILSAVPTWADYSRHLNKSLSFCGEAVQLNRPEVYQAVDQNLLLLAEANSRIWLSLRRSGRFHNVVAAELKKAGVPADLIYIPWTITGFAPEYNSGGRGIWRLKDAEAKALGLRVDGTVDERLDPVASTRAAAKRLSDLKNVFGSWTTAMAAYLQGDKIIAQVQAEASGEKDFYKLYLPDGLDQLPASVLAGKLIFQDPAAFGYHQSADRAWSPFPTRRETVKQATTARALATQLKKDYKLFRDMNPHLLTGIIPAGVTVNIP